jgi:hypothetical protein
MKPAIVHFRKGDMTKRKTIFSPQSLGLNK